VSQQLTLLSQRGSDVIFGDLLIVPIENSFLYVQPVFVTAPGQTPIPELKRVVVVHGGNVSVANSLADAIDLSFGQAPPPPSGGPGPTPGGSVADLLGQALLHFQRAQQFLQQGNLAGYQAEINAAQKLIQQAAQLSKSGASPSPTPSPSPSG
jgi:uncharacterized membrane protein (UPF0182 family)